MQHNAIQGAANSNAHPYSLNYASLNRQSIVSDATNDTVPVRNVSNPVVQRFTQRVSDSKLPYETDY